VGATVRRNVPGVVAGLCLGLLALGPGLRRGFLLSYDMVFVPREPFAAALPGLGPPRAVPSGLLVAAASRVVPADVVQKLVLLAIFVLGCAGVAALLDREPLLARLAGGVFYAWNPYVGERLIIGQWALLLGYAGLPWVLRAVLSAGQGRWGWTGRLCLSLVPAVIGGFAAMTITALVVVPAALLTAGARRVVIALAALAVGSLPWLIPSLQHAVYADPAGVAAFAARADTPFGTIGSLVMLGGGWNAQTVPKAYGGAWSALWLVIVIAALAGALRARAVRAGEDSPGRWPGLGVAAAAGLVIACIGVTSAGRDLLRAVTAAFPGAAVLRDGQQFVAPLALLEATGFGMAVAWAMKPGSFGLRWPLTGTDAVSDRLRVPWCDRPREDRKSEPRELGRPTGAGVIGAVIGIFALLAPVLLLPGLAWGAAGRLRPAWYPAGWLAAARIIDASPARGDVLLLPWQTYRTPSWNHGEVMFDPWSLLLSRPVIWNDGTRVGDVELAPDDPRARRLDGVIGGGGPLTASLSAAGVRFVLGDQDEPGQVSARLPGAVVLVRQPGLTVYQLPG
jgi:hypothetical protein